MGEAEGRALGRQLLEEMRRWDHLPYEEREQAVTAQANEPAGEDDEPSATDLLRFGAGELDDDTLWAATMTAVELATGDGERWMIGDGVLCESIFLRDALYERWLAVSRDNPAAMEVNRVMRDPRWNWDLNYGGEWIPEA